LKRNLVLKSDLLKRKIGKRPRTET